VSVIICNLALQTIDENSNGQQDETEDVHVFWIDLKPPKKGARLY